MAIICLAKGCQGDFCISKCCPEGGYCDSTTVTSGTGTGTGNGTVNSTGTDTCTYTDNGVVACLVP